MIFWHCTKKVPGKFETEDYKWQGAEYILYKSSAFFLFFFFCFILSGVACMFFVFLFPSVLEKTCHFWGSFLTVAFLCQGHVRFIGT